MRMTTKLKQMLYMYDAKFSIDEDGWITLCITEKTTGEKMDFSGRSPGLIIGKAHSYFIKYLKSIEKQQKPVVTKRKTFSGDMEKQPFALVYNDRKPWMLSK